MWAGSLDDAAQRGLLARVKPALKSPIILLVAWEGGETCVVVMYGCVKAWDGDYLSLSLSLNMSSLWTSIFSLVSFV